MQMNVETFEADKLPPDLAAHSRGEAGQQVWATPFLLCLTRKGL